MIIGGNVRLFVREVVSVLQGLSGALRRHWVRWDLRLAPRLRAIGGEFGASQILRLQTT